MNDNKGEARWGGLKRGRLIHFRPLKREGVLEREGVFEVGGLTEDLRYYMYAVCERTAAGEHKNIYLGQTFHQP